MLDTLDPLPLRPFNMIFNDILSRMTTRNTRLGCFFQTSTVCTCQQSAVRSSAIVSADYTGPETHTGARNIHTAATDVQESCRSAQGQANAVMYPPE